MRISTSDNYFCGGKCVLGDTCERHYCNDHRLLYRDCDTAIEDMEGDGDVPGGLNTFWSSQGECPECNREFEAKKRKREMERLFQEAQARHPGKTICPECWGRFVGDRSDDMAIHLVDEHGWASDKAGAWLREKVEAEAFNDEP